MCPICMVDVVNVVDVADVVVVVRCVCVFGRLLGRPLDWLCWAREPRDEKQKRNWWDAFEVKGRGWFDVAMDE